MSGALFWEDLVTLAIEAGFCRPVLYSSESMVVKNERVQARLPGNNCDVTICECFSDIYINLHGSFL